MSTLSQAGAAPRRGLLLSALIALRPRQWAKNLLLFGGLIFTRSFTDRGMTLLAAEAFVIFCALSSGVYILNDIRDRERDALHPEKSRRPIAAGDLPLPLAIGLALALIAAGLLGALFLSPRFASVGVGYLVLQAAYSFGFKDVVILDVFLIATGFVLRALAGAVVLSVTFSPWLFLCTMMLALFLGFGKRRSELVTLGEGSGGHRPALGQYNVALLDQAVGLTATATVMSYALYTITSNTGQTHRYLMLTIPFVLYGVLRYLFHLYANREGGSPDRLLFADIHMLVTVALWIAASILAMIYGGERTL